MSCLHLETTSSPKPRRLQKPRRQLQCFFGVGRRFTEGLTGLVFPRSKPPCTFFFLMPPAIISALTCHCFSFLYLLASAVHPSIHLCIHHSTLQRGLMTDWWSPAGLLPNRGPFTLVKPSCQLPTGVWPLAGVQVGPDCRGGRVGVADASLSGFTQVSTDTAPWQLICTSTNTESSSGSEWHPSPLLLFDCTM